MEVIEDIVIVGAGISGLTTSLALHRYITSLIPNWDYIAFNCHCKMKF